MRFVTVEFGMGNIDLFWAKFVESAARRNKAVHEGRIATPTEAEESLRATSALVAYLKLPIPELAGAGDDPWAAPVAEPAAEPSPESVVEV